MDNDEITYKAVGFFNKIKFGVSSLFVRIAASFGPKEVAESKTLVEDIEGEQEIEVEVIEEEEPSEPEEGIDLDEEEDLTVHEVEMTATGFKPKEITIDIGDTIEWKNVRTKKPNTAMIVGAQLCRDIRSKTFKPGETFSWTFDEPQTCTIVDGIYATETMKVTVK